jgi:DNA primase large subunit
MEAPAAALPDGPCDCPPEHLRADGRCRYACPDCHEPGSSPRWYRYQGKYIAGSCKACADKLKAYVDSKTQT